jgi:transposase
MSKTAITTIGIDLGKYSFHVIGFDRRGAIVLRQKRSRHQLESSLANIPACLIGMEACVGAHHLGRKLEAMGHQVRLMPAQYVNSKVIRTTTRCGSDCRSRSAADHAVRAAEEP